VSNDIAIRWQLLLCYRQRVHLKSDLIKSACLSFYQSNIQMIRHPGCQGTFAGCCRHGLSVAGIRDRTPGLYTRNPVFHRTVSCKLFL